jgi:hypothetical protein
MSCRERLLSIDILVLARLTAPDHGQRSDVRGLQDVKFPSGKFVSDNQARPFLLLINKNYGAGRFAIAIKINRHYARAFTAVIFLKNDSVIATEIIEFH